MRDEVITEKMRRFLINKKIILGNVTTDNYAFFVSHIIFAGLLRNSSESLSDCRIRLMSGWKCFFEGYRVYDTDIEDGEIYLGEKIN